MPNESRQLKYVLSVLAWMNTRDRPNNDIVSFKGENRIPRVELRLRADGIRTDNHRIQDA